MELKRLFIKVVPEDWERRLAAISPQTDRFSWLKLIWEEGYPWEPVERYLIYQMIPGHAVQAEVLEQLEDPHPPSKHGNYYDLHFENEDGTLGKFIRNPDCLITERAWKLFRTSGGCWGRPYWVIQGENGGHKRWFSTNEKKLLKLAGLPQEPPAPGDLPYAEYDEKVERHLQMLDLFKGIHSNERRKLAFLNEKRELESAKTFRIQLTRWLAEQVAEIAPDVHKGLLEVDAPRSKTDPAQLEEMYETAERDFIETGNSKHSLIHRV